VKKRKLRGVFSIVGSVTAATSAATSLRRARAEKDRLLLANAVASIAAAVTGALLAVRRLRKEGHGT
jgi:hypothetical protein